MNLSVFDLFKIGIGPSSSHTMGPMRAANDYLDLLEKMNLFSQVNRIKVELFGSLGATGVGHGSGPAILLGLEGQQADQVDPNYLTQRIAEIAASKTLRLANKYELGFNSEHDVVYTYTALPQHPNGMRFSVFNQANQVICEREYFSVGGGFVLDQDQIEQTENEDPETKSDGAVRPYPFTTMQELLSMCGASGLSICQIMMENETQVRNEQDVRRGLLDIWQVMQACVQRGCEQDGVLPGGLKVKRRAAKLHAKLSSRPEACLSDPLSVIDWVNLYALAVNEENAAGGRIVTAPTNGAAGIVPAVMHYYSRFYSASNDDGIVRFLLTAAAIGMLCKHNASISGAEVGCQGEVGSACAMAAAGLAAVSGGTPEQIENAAEIAMEHNLGLTCDPIAGLVQVPCIERNAMASIKAINASRLSLNGDGEHFVSLDKVIETMRKTGADMQSKYKETSLGGLAVTVNLIEC